MAAERNILLILWETSYTMIQSMTGFGRGCASSSRMKITVEVKSLNSKQLDLTLRVPSFLRESEVKARSVISDSLQRGKVDLAATVESIGSDTSATVNIELLKGYKTQIEEMARELALPEPSDWYATLLRLPDALKTETQHTDEGDVEAFMNALAEAVAGCTASRVREGEKLYRFLESKVSNIAALLSEVEPYEQERVPKVRARLEEQLARLDSIEYDRGRLEQELIFYIEKLDVNEEKQRLRSHLNYFMETLGDAGSIDTAAAGQGKKLGFIAQEMGREINTLGSKSNHADMQKIVVRMKDELEQIKEQVLNVL